MLKGCQREMIVLQTADSAIFENAYFVLRRACGAPPKTDMLAEANRIIGMGSEYVTRRRPWRGVLLFLSGAAVGIGLFLLIRLFMGR